MSRVLPILFNTDMVRAILDGRKTVTRRLIKNQNAIHCFNCASFDGKEFHFLQNEEFIYDSIAQNLYCKECGYPILIDAVKDKRFKAPYQPGDTLYCRETWNTKCSNCEMDCPAICNAPYYVYKADIGETEDKWKPSIHMPKEAARIWLKVTDVRVERLQEITEEQAECEGIRAYTKDGKLYKYAVTDDWWIDFHKKHRKLFSGTFWQDMPRTAKEAFSYLWNSTIKKSDLDRYGWDANPYVWVIEFERCEKPEPCILRGVEPAEYKRPCIGYSVSETDDELCEMCKQCPICTGND